MTVEKRRRARPTWVVFDYGDVLSRRSEAMSAIGVLLSASAADVEVAYWRHRKSYDVDSDDERYWAAVAADVGQDLSADLLPLLVGTDVSGWLHLADGAESLLHDLHAARVPMALLSNAPAALGDAVERQPWSTLLRYRVFSGRVGAIKPAAGIFDVLLATLGAEPSDCVFFDDRSEHVESASEMGLRAHLWHGVDAARVTLTEYNLLI